MITKGDDGKRNALVIENVAHVPSSPKNLISISQWEEGGIMALSFVAKVDTQIFIGTTTLIMNT